MSEFFAITLYVATIFTIGFTSVRRQSASSFLIGDRKLNFWVTAMAAHASDMSTWLFLGFPALIYTHGMSGIWSGVGLVLFMYLNWQLLAPRIRRMTEHYGSLTFSSFFESRFHDTSGMIRIITALMSLLFYLFYVSAGLIGLGLVINQLFHIPYHIGITIGIAIIIPYLFYGGYTALASVDLFQGLFLLSVIVFVPFVAIKKVPEITFSMPPVSLQTILYAILGWGLGYFGQPHIATKFMGIRHSKDIPKSMIFGMSWQVLTLSAAALIGLIAVPYFKTAINPEHLFLLLVNDLFSPFLAAIILCAVLAAIISTMDSQILVLATTLTEDFYKRTFNKKASSKQLLFVSRLCILSITAIAYLIALKPPSSIYELVLYAWSGLGSAFGPIMLFALFSKKTSQKSAWAGILTGGLISALWPLFHMEMPPIIPGFFGSFIAILITATMDKNAKTATH